MLTKKFKNNTIILASGSPRRQELLKKLGLEFKIEVKSVNEIYPSALKKEEITNYLAKLKVSAFENQLKPSDILITADTIVWLNNKPLEKPKNHQQAVEMLKQLSNTSHEVITSVCIKTLQNEKLFFDETTVHFKKLSDEEINFYVDTYKPFDKAGAYGIQEWIGYIGVTKIEGSYFNVMGLPVQKLYEELLKM